MPIHDWTRVKAGIFHDFRHEWITTIKHALNRNLQGTNYYAMAEQVAGGIAPDVLTLQLPSDGPKRARSSDNDHRGGVALAEAPPKLRYRIKNSSQWYAKTKKSVAIRHVSEHRVVAVLEIVSPGNKSSVNAIQSFIAKAGDLLGSGVHLDLVDLFPPTPRDPGGIHLAVWGEDEADVFRFDPAKPLTCASYIGGGGAGADAFVEPVAVGDTLPMMPLFLTCDQYVDVPLESTYMDAFEQVPDVWREVLT